LRNRRV